MKAVLPTMLMRLMAPVEHMMTSMWAWARRKALKVSISAWQGRLSAVMSR